MAAVCSDDRAPLGLGVLFNDIAGVAEGHAWLHNSNGLVEALAGRFDEADVVCIGDGLVAYIVCLIEIAVVASVID